MYHGGFPRGRRRRRRGTILLMVVVALVVLMLFAGMTIDLGVMWVMSQRTQDAADAAALAAAAELPTQDSARAQAQSILTALNENQVRQFTLDDATDFTFYAAGETISGYGELESGAQAVEVRCHTQVPYMLLRLMGLQTQALTCRAVARQKVSDGVLPFIFAHKSTTSATGVTINGSGMTVNGDIHSNTRVVINGSSQTVNGTVEWLNRLTVNGSNCYIKNDVEGEVLEYPLGFTYAKFLAYCTSTLSKITLNGSGLTAPVGYYHVTGNVTFNGSGLYAHDSIYVVDGSITINGSGCKLTNCTFVATGNITANGSSIAFATPNTDHTLFYSTGGNIVTNGSGSTDEGIVYAPAGSITYNGSSTCVRNGSLLAETITINGSGFQANGTTMDGAGGSTVALIR